MKSESTSVDLRPLAVLSAVLLGAWAWLFHELGNSSFGYVNTESLFVWLYRWYQLPSIGESGDELCPFVPLVVGVLLYLRREEIRSAPKAPWTPALVLVGVGLGLHLFGYLSQQVRVSALGFIVGALGVIGAVWGRRVLQLVAGPWMFLVFAIPLAAYTDGLTFHLRVWVTKLSVGFCKVVLNMPLDQFGTIVFRLPTQFSGGFRFDVAPACSGIRSMLAVLFVTAVFVHLNTRIWWHGLVLLVAAVPFALLGNALRLVIVFLTGDAISQNAGKVIETKLGFLTYALALLGVFLLARWLRRREAVTP